MAHVVRPHLAALICGMRAALARARACPFEVDPRGARFAYEIDGASRLADASLRLADAFARLSYRRVSRVTLICVKGGRAVKTRSTAYPSWCPPLRARTEGGGVPPTPDDVRMVPKSPRRRGGQPGNTNRLVHGGRSAALRRPRADVAALVRRTEALIAQLAQLAALRPVLEPRIEEWSPSCAEGVRAPVGANGRRAVVGHDAALRWILSAPSARRARFRRQAPSRAPPPRRGAAKWIPPPRHATVAG